MSTQTPRPGLIRRVDQAATGQASAWMINLGRRHPITWGIGRGIGMATWGLPKRAISRTRGAYQRWSDDHTVTKTFHIDSGEVTTHKGRTPPPEPSGPGTPVATVTNINASKQKQSRPQSRSQARPPARPQKPTGATMARATSEMKKHGAGRHFTKFAASIEAFETGTQYRHVSLLEFLDDAHGGFDRIALGLDSYATSLFELGAHTTFITDLFSAVDAAETVMDTVDVARRRLVATYGDIIDQESSSIGAISAGSTRGGQGTGTTGTGQAGAAIRDYYAGVQLAEGAEASQILADLRAAQHGYALAKLQLDDLANRLTKNGFNSHTRDRVRRIADDATSTATTLRRSGRTLMRLYAPQLRHEGTTTPHLRVV